MLEVTLNLNDYVYIRMTDFGRQEHKRQYEELRKEFRYLPEDAQIKEDDDGWSRWQLYNIMNIFGHLLYNGAQQLPFETYIKFKY
jgi:hypothetical protein